MKQIISIIIIAFYACNNSEKNNKAEKVIMNEIDSLRISKGIDGNITADNHGSTMDLIFGKPKHNIKTIGILVYNGVNDLDMMGPRHILGQA